MRRLFLIGAVAIIPAMSSLAQPPADADQNWRRGLTTNVLVCQSAPENSGTLGQALCYRDELARQDQRLNEIWHQLSPDRRNGLRDSERSWIKQRDQNCRDEASGYINMTAAYMNNFCMVKETIRRITSLKSNK